MEHRIEGSTSAPSRHSGRCAHCPRIFSFPSMRKLQEHADICRACVRLVCLGCAGKPCRPYEREVERQEREYRLRHAIEKTVWGCY